MAEYRLTETDNMVIRTADGAYIPNDAENCDWQVYQEWLAGGGVPDPLPPMINPTLDTKPAKTAAQILGV